jgi:hypothetical protein
LNLFRVLPSVAAAAFAFAISANSAAYCLTYTCDVKTGLCPMEAGCNVGGLPLFWAREVVSFDVQKDGSKRQDISYDQLHAVVRNAFQRWVDADCGDGQHPSIIPADYGPVSCNKPEYNKTQENQNVITFHDAEWPYKDRGAETLALTTVHFNPETGEIYDANIELNSYDANFVIGTGDADSEHDDLNAVLTHEIGHFLGLSHSSVPSATMYTSYMLGMTTLEEDDVAAICASLPPGRAVAEAGNPPGVPRHGFSTECAGDESGCCSSTIGGKAPSSGPLALWAFGLGALVWVGRGRRRAGRARGRAG